MIDDVTLNDWFCMEVLPYERALTLFIRSNWRAVDEVMDLRQEIYERALVGARAGLPCHTRPYLYAVARNHLINRAKRARIVSFELIADLERLEGELDLLATDRHLSAREELRRAQLGLDRLPRRCRQVILLRKIEGLSTREVAQRLNISTDTVEKQMTLGMRALVDFMLGGTGKIVRGAATPRQAARRRS
jgi:RNA polymerase sigma-70 factor (ECF subfamily)